MNVVCDAELKAERVWYDAVSGRLCVQAGEYVNGVDLARIPEEDFESQTPIRHLRIHPSRRKTPQ